MANAPDERAAHLCPLHFRLCIGVAELPCLVLAANFSHTLRPPLDAIPNRTFALLDFPPQRFPFTSTAIDSPNISVSLSVFSGANGKMQLFSRNFTNGPLQVGDGQGGGGRPQPSTLQYAAYGNLLVYQLQAHCAHGFVGPKCAIFCEPPRPGDNYVCTARGAQCRPGWTAARCTQPVCSSPCRNGGRCIGPDQCACPTGWHGPLCEKCKPRVGCQHGFCTGEPGKCFCQPNWTGPNCNLLVNKCLERPCKNGGLCTTDGLHGNYFRCICPPGFVGLDCAISYAVCKNATCGPNQRCAPLERSYSCVCDPGFGGPDCEQKQGGEEEEGRRRVVYNQTVLPIRPAAPAKHLSSMNSSAVVSSSSLQAKQHSHNGGSDFGMIKRLVGACFFLLLVILAILCCGQHTTALHCPMATRLMSPRPLMGQTMAPELGEAHSGDQLPKSARGATAFIRVNSGTGVVHWGSSSSATDDDELDSGLGSIHSTHPPIGESGRAMALQIEQQQQRRLVHWSGTMQMQMQMQQPSPPPSYEESLRATPNSEDHRTVLSQQREAFV